MPKNLHGVETHATFGKHEGKPWSEVPTDYILWLRKEMLWKLKVRKKDTVWGHSRMLPVLEKELLRRGVNNQTV